MNRLSELKKRLRELDEEIIETKKRLPAHSVKPPVMMDLLALEDEYDDLLKRIEDLKIDHVTTASELKKRKR